MSFGGGQVVPVNSEMVCTTTEDGREMCIRTTRRELPQENTQEDWCGCEVKQTGEDHYMMDCNGFILLMSGERLESLRSEPCGLPDEQ